MKERKKAFLGAAIGIGGSIIGGLLGASKAKKQARLQAAMQRRAENLQVAQQGANNLNATLANYDELGDAEIRQYEAYRYGGEYRDRNKKAWGGWGELVGGISSAIGSIASGATGNPLWGAVGQGVGSLAQNAIDARNNKLLETKQQSIEKPPLPTLPSNYGANTLNRLAADKINVPRLPAMHKYGGRIKYKPLAV